MATTPHQQHLAAAREAISRGAFADAEQRYLLLLNANRADRDALLGLASLYLGTSRLEPAERVFHDLVALWPAHAGFQLDLAAVMERNGKLQAAAATYINVIRAQPDFAVAHFNYACFLRRAGQREAALREHQRALDLKIEKPEEVLSNMAVINSELRKDEQARELLERALAANPDHIPAMYNLGQLREEFGDREGALALFNRILDLDPTYYNALVRIANAQRISSPDDPVMRKVRRALRRSKMDALSREGLNFAMGKMLDDCGRYDEAFEHFKAGNESAAARVTAYDRPAVEQRIQEVIELFTPQWLGRVEPVSDRPLIFITGMFRSGSTLIEQVLAAHPRIAPGGEIDFFGRALAGAAKPFPDCIADMDSAALHQLGNSYLQYLERTFPTDRIVTNKRPDAFAWLGLIRALFPNARFINTVRDPLDTCLSIYMQQLDERIVYATDLENCAHYYQQYRRLMEHWEGLFGDRICDAVYDAYVVDREPVTRALLDFLELDWCDACLEVQHLGNRVRTASVWQVREPVYRRASGRWRNYERHLQGVRRMLDL